MFWALTFQGVKLFLPGQSKNYFFEFLFNLRKNVKCPLINRSTLLGCVNIRVKIKKAQQWILGLELEDPGLAGRYYTNTTSYAMNGWESHDFKG